MRFRDFDSPSQRIIGPVVTAKDYDSASDGEQHGRINGHSDEIHQSYHFRDNRHLINNGVDRYGEMRGTPFRNGYHSDDGYKFHRAKTHGFSSGYDSVGDDSYHFNRANTHGISSAYDGGRGRRPSSSFSDAPHMHHRVAGDGHSRREGRSRRNTIKTDDYINRYDNDYHPTARNFNYNAPAAWSYGKIGSVNHRRSGEININNASRSRLKEGRNEGKKGENDWDYEEKRRKGTNKSKQKNSTYDDIEEYYSNTSIDDDDDDNIMKNRERKAASDGRDCASIEDVCSVEVIASPDDLRKKKISWIGEHHEENEEDFILKSSHVSVSSASSNHIKIPSRLSSNFQKRKYRKEIERIRNIERKKAEAAAAAKAKSNVVAAEEEEIRKQRYDRRDEEEEEVLAVLGRKKYEDSNNDIYDDDRDKEEEEENNRRQAQRRQRQKKEKEQQQRSVEVSKSRCSDDHNSRRRRKNNERKYSNRSDTEHKRSTNRKGKNSHSRSEQYQQQEAEEDTYASKNGIEIAVGANDVISLLSGPYDEELIKYRRTNDEEKNSLRSRLAKFNKRKKNFKKKEENEGGKREKRSKMKKGNKGENYESDTDDYNLVDGVNNISMIKFLNVKKYIKPKVIWSKAKLVRKDGTKLVKKVKNLIVRDDYMARDVYGDSSRDDGSYDYDNSSSHVESHNYDSPDYESEDNYDKHHYDSDSGGNDDPEDDDDHDDNEDCNEQEHNSNNFEDNYDYQSQNDNEANDGDIITIKVSFLGEIINITVSAESTTIFMLQSIIANETTVPIEYQRLLLPNKGNGEFLNHYNPNNFLKDSEILKSSKKKMVKIGKGREWNIEDSTNGRSDRESEKRDEKGKVKIIRLVEVILCLNKEYDRDEEGILLIQKLSKRIDKVKESLATGEKPARMIQGVIAEILEKLESIDIQNSQPLRKMRRNAIKKADIVNEMARNIRYD